MKPIFKFQDYPQGLNVSGYFYRDGDDRLYQRIWAGIVPPSGRAGAIVVIAQELSLRPPASLFVVATGEEQAADNLLQKCLDFRALYQIEQFYGRTKDSDFLRYLSHWNAERREKHLKTVEISTAPNSSSDGNIAFHISLLRSRLTPNNKILTLNDSKLLPAAFQELSMSDVSTAKDNEHPLLAALGYVVAALDLYAADWNDQKPEFAKTEYDLFADREDDYSIDN